MHVHCLILSWAREAVQEGFQYVYVPLQCRACGEATGWVSRRKGGSADPSLARW